MVTISFYKKSKISLNDCIKELKELDFSTHDWFTKFVVYINIFFKTKRCLEFYQEMYKDSVVLYDDTIYTFDFSRDVIEYNYYNLKSITFEQFGIQIKQVISEFDLKFNKEQYKLVEKYFKDSGSGYTLVLIN